MPDGYFMAQQSLKYQSATAELTDYWNRRPNLSQTEWERFYILVRGSLMNSSAPQLASLPEAREVYLIEFFEEKIFNKVQREFRELQVGALREFFRRYLNSKIRTLPKTIQMSALDDSDSDEPFISSIPDPNPVDPDVQNFFSQVSPQDLADSARSFVETLEDRHCRMLAGHYCASDPVPMATLFAGVNGYHYQAQKLGVVSNFRLGYEHTLIGQWMISLGVKPSFENENLVHLLLKALCFSALEYCTEVDSND